MKKCLQLWIFLIAAVFMAIAVAGCGFTDVEPLSGDASLTSIIFHNRPYSNLPPALEMDAFDFQRYDKTQMAVLGLVANNEDQLTSARIQAVPGHSGAKLQYAKGSNTDPETWRMLDVGRTWGVELDDGDYIYISVRSEDSSLRTFYKAQVTLSNDEVRVFDILFGSHKIAASSGIVPYDTPEDALLFHNVIIVPQDFINDLTECTVRADPMSRGADISYWKMPVGEDLSGLDWSDNNVYDFETGDYLFVRVKSSDETATGYFAVRVSEKTDEAGLKDMWINGERVEGTYTPATSGQNSLNNVITVTVPADSPMKDENGRSLYTVRADPVDRGAEVHYLRGTGASYPTQNVDYRNITVWDFANGNTLYVRITPSIGSGQRFYAFRINVQ